MPPSITVSVCSATQSGGPSKGLSVHDTDNLMAKRRCLARCLSRVSCYQSPRFTMACQLPLRVCKAVQPHSLRGMQR